MFGLSTFSHSEFSAERSVNVHILRINFTELATVKLHGLTTPVM